MSADGRPAGSRPPADRAARPCGPAAPGRGGRESAVTRGDGAGFPGGRPGAPPGDGHTDPDGLPDLAAAVLDVVDLVPPGRVATYGDVAEYLAQDHRRVGPRQVGAVMARFGGAVAWWRVLRADGSPPQGHEREALERYRSEGTPLRAGGTKVDLRRARWDGT